MQAVNPAEEIVMIVDEQNQPIAAVTRKIMRQLLADIQNGVYAREWILENQAGRPGFNLIRKREQNSLIEQVGRKLRAMMPWLNAK